MWKRPLLAAMQFGAVAEAYRHPLAIQREEFRSSSPISWRIGKQKRLDKGQGPTVRSGPLARLEAALFVAREPVSSRRLAQLASLPDGTRARSLANQLRKIYDLRGTPFQIEEVAGGFQLLSRRKYAQWIRRLEHPVSEIRLSSPASETLAVVAYRQPVLRAEIEAIRGVQCGEILRQLMERDLVRITGRSHDLGRPFVYGTTRRFLQVFGLRHLDELPRREELNLAAIVSGEAVAMQPIEGQDSGLNENQNTESVSEEKAVVICRAENDGREEGYAEVEDEALRPAVPIRALSVDDEDDDFDDDEEDDDDYDDEEDDDYDDDEEDEDDDWDDEEDDDEEDDDEEDEDDELEGDWEEVDDDDEEDDDYDDDDEEEEEDDDWEEED